MKFIAVVLLTFISLFAQNPDVYSSLGDKIYNNLVNIENLKKIDEYKGFSFKIDQYLSDAKKTKSVGFEIESGRNTDMKLEYLNKLRKLEEQNDYFSRSAYDSFEKSIKNNDSELFSKMINSGMIDIKKYKKQILNYYNLHAQEIDTQGTIENLLDEENEKKKARQYYQKNKQKIDEAKIKRIRESDKAEQEALEKRLEDELRAKKQKIREAQERELFKN